MQSVPSRRMFIGLMPSRVERAAIAAWRDRWTWPAGSRLVLPDDVHLTLHFLGAVSTTDETLLKAGLATVRPQPMHLQLACFEVWPSGVVVLRPTGDERLRRLHEAIGAVLADIGCPNEQRAWKPHVTLAREAGHAKPPAGPIAFVWHASTFSLVWSRGGRGLSKYEVLASWPGQPSTPYGDTM